MGSRQRRYSRGGGPRPGCGEPSCPWSDRCPPDTDFVRLGDRLSACRGPRGPRPEPRGPDHETTGVSPGQGATARRADAGPGIDQRAGIVSAGGEHSRPPRGRHCPGGTSYPGSRPSRPPRLASFRRACAASLPPVWQITSAAPNSGLFQAAAEAGRTRRRQPRPAAAGPPAAGAGQRLVTGAAQAILQLEGRGQFGPYALVLGHGLFLIAETPDPSSLVLPQDRIIPFLGGGSLLRSSALQDVRSRAIKWWPLAGAAGRARRGHRTFRLQFLPRHRSNRRSSSAVRARRNEEEVRCIPDRGSKGTAGPQVSPRKRRLKSAAARWSR